MSSVGLESTPLTVYPFFEPSGKLTGLTHRSPTRQRDADAAIFANGHDVTAGTRMTNEERRRILWLEWKTGLHLGALDLHFVVHVERQAVGQLARLQHPRHSIDGLQRRNFLDDTRGLQLLELSCLDEDVPFE